MLLNRLATREVTRLYGGLTDFESASRLEPASVALDRVGEKKEKRREKRKTGEKRGRRGRTRKRRSRERPRASRGGREKWREVKKRGGGGGEKKKKKGGHKLRSARLCLFTLTAVFLSAYV